MPNHIMPDTVMNMLRQDEPELMAGVSTTAAQRGAEEVSAAATDFLAGLEKPARGR